MITRLNTKNGQQVSQLSFGCMRFPKSDDETQRLIEYAVQNGVTHFDTAYVYGNSEVVLGRILQRTGLRGSITIATKLPLHKVKRLEDLDKIFYEQLKRLQTTWVDYYFMHCMAHVGTWKRLQKLGIEGWIESKKRSGEIANLGFSFHGGSEDFAPIVDAYGWDFCMIQFNYTDENYQAGRAGLEYLAERAIPIMIMEPLRGGELVNKLPAEAVGIFAAENAERSPAEWAHRWVFNHPQILTSLSGMSNMAMLEENIRVASVAGAGNLSAQELEVFERVKAVLKRTDKINCTTCGYCVPACAMGVDIPACFSCYNEIAVSGKRAAFKKYVMTTSMKTPRSNAGRCNGCGACEKLCPQQVGIAAELKRVRKKLEPFYYRPAAWVMKRVLKLEPDA